MGLLTKKPDPYYEQIARLQLMLRMTEPGTEEFDKLLDQIDRLQEQKQKSKVLHRRVHTDLKKPIVAGGVFAALLGFNHWLDSNGDLLTGQAKKNSEGLLSSIVRTFTSFKFW